jgi:hypothetical protein
MEKVYGNFSGQDLTQSEEYLAIRFSPTSVPLKQRWRNNGLSADFLGDYLATFFPAADDDLDALERQAQIKSAVSYIANELLENAMKFNDDSTGYHISIQLHLFPDHLLFVAGNSLSPERMARYEGVLEELLNNDPQELYLLKLERNAEDENSQVSGLGLLTMMNDYGSIIGCKFSAGGSPPISVATTMVRLDI